MVMPMATASTSTFTRRYATWFGSGGREGSFDRIPFGMSWAMLSDVARVLAANWCRSHT